MPPDLFTADELEAYPPATTVAPATAALVLALVTADIRSVVGATRYDALTDVTALKSVALSLARRMVDNPGGVRSRQRQVDDYSETNTYATESMAPAVLTDSDRDRILAAVGLSTGGAFSIRPAGVPDRPLGRRPLSVWRRC